jgi:DNA-binding NarL/FixJ family response regulator
MLRPLRLRRCIGIGSALTPQEYKILILIAKGYSNKEIAMQLSISYNTVKGHVYNIFSKVGVTNRTAAVLRASRKHLIPPYLE